MISVDPDAQFRGFASPITRCPDHPIFAHRGELLLFRSRAMPAVSKDARRNNRRASNCHRSLPMAKGQSPERSRRGAADAGSRTISIGEAYQRYPPRPFFSFCCKQSTFVNRRLGLPWATQGPRLGHPRATQGPPKPKPKSAEGRKP
jgi:hypothetical protein